MGENINICAAFSYQPRMVRDMQLLRGFAFITWKYVCGVCVCLCVFVCVCVCFCRWAEGRYTGRLISVGVHNVGSSTPLPQPSPPPLNPPLPALNVRKSCQLNSDATVGILPCFG